MPTRTSVDASGESPAHLRAGSRAGSSSGNATASIPGVSANPPPQPAVPSLSLPKGGGAIRGMGETFAVSGATGTGRLELPLPLTAGRGGLFGGLTLGYDSGAGNGPFGLGFSLSLPQISRRTDAGLPRYLDDTDSDDFVLSGAETLVRKLDAQDQPLVRPARLHGRDYRVATYLPRTEGAHARIEYWRAGADSFWRVIDAQNVTSIFGADGASRIADPADPTRIHTWLLARVHDDKGNLVQYDYAAEDDAGVDTAALHEMNRDRAAILAQRYPKRIRYSADQPWFADYSPDGPAPGQPARWRHQVVFDYGDHDPDAPGPDPDRPWAPRPDPFSTCRAGFELRSHRRCQRIVMFHDFPEDANCGPDCPVRSVELTYADIGPQDAGPSLMTGVTQTGWRRLPGGGYLRRSLPPLSLDYAPAAFGTERHTAAELSGGTLSEVLDGRNLQLLDLNGDGRPGLLERRPDGWTYRENFGATGGMARFGPAQPVAPLPVTAALSQAQVLDVAGNGSPDLVVWQGPLPGLFERDAAGGWQPFTPFDALPRIDMDDPDLRFIDLTGDGRADLLITSDAALVIHASKGAQGFDPAHRLPLATDERAGPRVLFSAPAEGEAILLADMTGDGLNDIVRLRHGQVCYWPNMGHGRFGRRVTMSDAPRFGPRDRFDPRRLRLADIDGSGTADLVWIGWNGVFAAANRMGNGFAPPQRIARLPDTASDTHVEVMDLLGRGTAALVWSSPRGDGRGQRLCYIDLMPGPKPHLLVASRNNLGAETRITYAPSTRFATQDALAGRPWVTRLPFPVQVVEKVETIDHIARIATSARHSYHHGHFDGIEREFAGFGRVDSWDSDAPIDGADNWQAATWSPPVMTRSWYHTGTPQSVMQAHSEAWQSTEPHLPAPIMPANLPAPESVEAMRPLRGTLLRSETYAQDGTALAPLPYVVTETCPDVVRLQPRGPNRHAVFAVLPRESLTISYERNPADPRIAHQLVLESDPWGRPLRALNIAYPRRTAAPVAGLAAPFAAMLAGDQARCAISATESRWTDATSGDHHHRLPLPCESMTYDLIGVTPTGRLSHADCQALWQQAWTGTRDLRPGEYLAAELDARPLPPGPWRRLTGHSRTRYRRDDFDGLLPLGQLQPLALTGQSWQLALTPEMVQDLLGDRITPADLTRGGHVQIDGHAGWWLPSGLVHLSPDPADTPATQSAHARAHFYLARRFTDPFGAQTHITHALDLIPVETRDALDNVTRADIDWRVMQPFRVTDPNGNRTEVAYDALARVAAHADRGPDSSAPGSAVGGDLSALNPDPDEAVLTAFFADPVGQAAGLVGQASARVIHDPFAFLRDASPPRSARMARERHALGADPAIPDRVTLSLSLCDGFAREIQVKSLVEPGPLTPDGPDIAPRWTCTGWTIFDNKARPVRSYEPFFTATHDYEPGRNSGAAVTTLYDPLGRAIAALHPDGSWTKTLISGWSLAEWDASDTLAVTDPRDDPDVGASFRQLLGTAPFLSWRARREAGQLGDTADARADQADALAKSLAHAGTPDIALYDSQGRPCLNLVDLGGRQVASRVGMSPGGATLVVIDALARRVVENGRATAAGRFMAGHDLLGRALYRRGMDDGERRILPDIRGQAVLAWDAMGDRIRQRLDALGRVTHRYVTQAGVETLRSLSVYGETAPAGRNLRGRLWRSYDGAGLGETLGHDFVGNLTAAARHLAADWRNPPDWTALEGLVTQADLDAAAAPLLAPGERYLSLTSHDALGRPVQSVTPHRADMRPSVVQIGYATGGLPQTLDLWLRQPAAPVGLLPAAGATRRVVRGSRHDAKGQRQLLALGNGVDIRHDHDPQTFRLTRLTAARGGGAVADRILQDLHHSHDASGNITRIRDMADQAGTIYFRNRRVDPGMDLTYDAAYRLTAARGREHLGQAGGALLPPGPDGAADRERLAHPGDGLAMGRYLQRYEHDDAGNLLRLIHSADSGSWTRALLYLAPSDLEPGVMGNRLSGARVSGQADADFDHDAQGRMTRMPHLSRMAWDSDDRLVATARQAVNAGLPETTHLVYDAGGARLRKVTDRAAATASQARRKADVITLGPLEIRREYGADGAAVTLEHESLHLDFGGARVATIRSRTQGTDSGPALTWRFALPTHQGSVAVELDETGAITSFEEYYPLGGTSYQATHSALETPKRHRFLGRERDEESGLYHFGARYYAPWLGRWTSADPAGLADGTNRYAYAGNDPVGLVDPGGMAGRKAGAEGDVTRHGSQGSRGGINPATKQAARESEHIWGIAHQRESLRNPATGLSPVPDGRGHALDRNSTTIQIQEALADTKTKADDAALRAFKNERAAGQVSAATAAELTPEAGLRRLGPNPSPGAHAAVIGQTDALLADPDVRAFARHPDNNPLVGATDADIDKAVNGKVSTGEMTTIATEQKPRSTSLINGNADKVAATEAKALATATEGAEVAAKTTAKASAKTATKAAAKTALKKLGTKALKVIPFVGIAAGLTSATAEAAEGNKGAAALDAVGVVPLVGDVVDAGRLGVAIGETADQLLGISDVASEHGFVAEGLAKRAGLSSDDARIVGATAAAVSAITVAPQEALSRTIAGWFN